jgi:molybdopterin-guanine dinucleotide biosynthesis protein B
MNVIGVVGWKNSGKTTFIVKLVELLTSCGLSVSTVKHAHHEFDIDRPGKDSYLHRESGAREVLVSSGRRWALMHELRGAEEPPLDELLGHLAPVDLVIVEGFKHYTHPKIEIRREQQTAPALAPGDPDIVALAADYTPPDTTLPVLPLEEPRIAAGFVASHFGFSL